MNKSCRDHLAKALREMARGDSTVEQATATVRGALAEGLDDEVYDGFRDLTWRTIASRGFGSELGAWFDLLRHAAALARTKSKDALSDRLRTLSDLLSQSARFEDLQPAAEVTGRKHVVDILRKLAGVAAPVRRAVLAQGLGLEDANLSRVLAIMSARGLVERTTSGKEALFALTEEGAAAARRHNLEVAHPRPDLADVLRKVPVAMGVFDEEGVCVLATDAFRGFFEPSPVLPALADWRRLVAVSRREGDDVNVNGRWIEAREVAVADGGHVAVGVDVTDRRHEAANPGMIRPRLGEMEAGMARLASLGSSRLIATSVHEGIDAMVSVGGGDGSTKSPLPFDSTNLRAFVGHIHSDLLALKYRASKPVFVSGHYEQVRDFSKGASADVVGRLAKLYDGRPRQGSGNSEPAEGVAHERQLVRITERRSNRELMAKSPSMQPKAKRVQTTKSTGKDAYAGDMVEAVLEDDRGLLAVVESFDDRNVTLSFTVAS